MGEQDSYRMLETRLITEIASAQAQIRAEEQRVRTEEKAEQQRVRMLQEHIEAFSLLIIFTAGIICLITGIGEISADLVMIIPNAGMLAYRHLKGP